MTAVPSLAALLRAYADGSARPVEVAEALVSRLHGAAGPGPAWISLVPPDDLLARARAMTGRQDLPLAGVPFAVKDNIDVAGLPTTAACPGFAYTPPATAPVVQRLLDAGALLVGKTNLDQFATGLVGTRSPYGACASVVDPRYVSGGSSSGSAVVVADGTVPFTLGTDTAGSGRVPAAFNGIVGVKPTRGVLSTRGVVPASRSLDCVSLFVRDVADAALVLDVVGVPDAEDPYARTDGRGLGTGASWNPGHPLRLAVPDAAGLAALDGDGRAGWARACAHASALGARLHEVPFAPFAEAGALLYDGPWLAERYCGLADVLAAEPAGLDPVVAQVILRGADLRAADLFTALHRLAELRRHTTALLRGCDALLTPTAPTVPTHAEVAADPIGIGRVLGTYTNFVNLLDLCGVAVPVAPPPGEATRARPCPPFGVTLLGPAGTDRTLLALAAAWTERPSAVPATAGSPGR
ncbi:MAG: allophanate hydrolase [Solirubrobacterales bacterium]|nr:allophanate hydrolase [Solirubrobacterales bacterium]